MIKYEVRVAADLLMEDVATIACEPGKHIVGQVNIPSQQCRKSIKQRAYPAGGCFPQGGISMHRVLEGEFV
jgi:hypothetical protein